jgi:hypothetical protein
VTKTLCRRGAAKATQDSDLDPVPRTPRWHLFIIDREGPGGEECRIASQRATGTDTLGEILFLCWAPTMPETPKLAASPVRTNNLLTATRIRSDSTAWPIAKRGRGSPGTHWATWPLLAMNRSMLVCRRKHSTTVDSTPCVSTFSRQAFSAWHLDQRIADDNISVAGLMNVAHLQGLW